MKRIIVILFIALFSLKSYGQEKPILVFDLVDGTVDSIPIIAYDTTNLYDHTDYFIGSFNSNTEILEQSPPVLNTYPNSNFTYKKRASTDFDLINYPIRTSVKLFSVENDTLSSLCSGSLISKKHVLTAAHCVSPLNSNILSRDSIKVSPVFDNGIFNAQFNSSYVSKIYFFRDWSFGSDISILELEESIGESTGWISIGFNKIDSLLIDGIFYKFTYPATTILQLDSNEYNGDSLYYNYGNVDIVTNTSIGINNTQGIPGESGSSLIKVINGQEYTSYGVLSISANLNHSKISNWQFYALKNIIADDLAPNIPPENVNETFIIYPNPVVNSFHVKNIDGSKIIEMVLYNNLGKKVLNIDTRNLNSGVDVSNLSNGIYYLRLTSNTSIGTKKIIKK